MKTGTQDAASRPEHQGIVDQSILEGIRHVLGESGLEMMLSLHPLSRLSADPVAFHELLESIFMADGAAVIEIEIASRLLETVGNGTGRKGRSFLSWLGGAFSRAKSSGGEPTREKDALRQFLALESVRKSRSAEGKLVAHRWTNRGRSFDLAAPRLGLGLKKGN